MGGRVRRLRRSTLESLRLLFFPLGVRTAAKMEEEMLALRIFRGDFGQPPGADAALER
jgi:hypothetical protein